MGGQPMACCWSCKYEKSLDGTPVCIRYRLKVAMLEICDDWDGGEPVFDPMGTGKVIFWYHEKIMTDEERAALR